MPDHRCASSAARPIAAGPVLPRWKCASIHLGTGENVVTIGRVAHTGNYGAPFRERGLHSELIAIVVKVLDVLCDDFLLEILPGPVPNAVACVNGLPAPCCLGAEIGMPGLAASAHRLRQRLTITIGALQPTEIRAFTRPDTGYKECHLRRLGWWLLCLCR
jgi:hypothetical protein